jgi:ankyrin repeat protein
MMLVDHGADVHLKNNDNDAPLDIAVRYNRQEVVSFLLDHDLSVLESSKALSEASRMGRVELVRMLLDMGTDVNMEHGEDKDTALHNAVRFCRVDVTEALLSYGADPYHPNAKGETPQNIMREFQDCAEKQKILEMIDGEAKGSERKSREREKRGGKGGAGQAKP